jgi:hypothetical protein
MSSPLDTFAIEKPAGSYKDFQIAESDPYPLKGVTYPVDYGDIEGYYGEDGDKLDFFMGTNGRNFGYIKVDRPDFEGGEHKFYARLSVDEVEAVKTAFAPVTLEHVAFLSEDELIQALEPFRKI